MQVTSGAVVRVLAVLCLVSSSAVAQRRTASASSNASMPWEIGADGGISFNRQSSGGTSVTTTVIQLPIPMIRAGVFLSPQISVEPALGLSRVSNSGGSVTTFNVIVGALYHFEPNRALNQPYVRPFIDYTHFSSSGSPGGSQTGFGVGLGIKHPLKEHNRMGVRGEVNIAHYDTSPGTLSIGLLGGFSIFTH
jgi:hypothetical protein